jgi:hypothetical protein
MKRNQAKERITRILQDTKKEGEKEPYGIIHWSILEQRLFDVINGLDDKIPYEKERK